MTWEQSRQRLRFGGTVQGVSPTRRSFPTVLVILLRDQQKAHRRLKKLINSVDVYIPLIRLVLPARFHHWSEPDESSFDSILFWTARVPRLRTGTGWQGTLN